MGSTSVQEGGGDYVMVVKGHQPALQRQAQISLPENFSPSVDDGRFRAWPHGVARHCGAATTLARMGFPHAAQVARVDRIRELKGGTGSGDGWNRHQFVPEQATAKRLLELVRLYWCIENGAHHPLDVSAREDQCRVRHPISATVLGILRRAVQGEDQAWKRQQRCQRDRSFPTFRDHMSRRINHVIRFATGATTRL